MFRTKTPAWVLVGGMVLACTAGCVNAVGLVGLHHQAVSHMSGNLSFIGIAAARGDSDLLVRTALITCSFFLGCAVSGFTLRDDALKLGRGYGLVLIGEAALLAGAVLFFRHDSFAGDYLAAAACGLQNAMASSYSGAVVRTTHMTGIVTDLGIALGQRLRGRPVETPRLRLYGVLLAGFVAGGLLGSVAFLHLGYDTLLLPAALCGVAGFGYFGFKRYSRHVNA